MGSTVTPLRRIAGAARILGVSPHTLARKDWREKNKVPTVKIGRGVRFDCDQLMRWVAEQQERPEDRAEVG